MLHLKNKIGKAKKKKEKRSVRGAAKEAFDLSPSERPPGKL